MEVKSIREMTTTFIDKINFNSEMFERLAVWSKMVTEIMELSC
jgi:hypothetical protein